MHATTKTIIRMGPEHLLLFFVTMPESGAERNPSRAGYGFLPDTAAFGNNALRIRRFTDFG
jgi:hypothetical protein